MEAGQSDPCTPRVRDMDRMSMFEKLALNMQDLTGDRGVLKEVIRAGDGETVPRDSTIIAKYSGYLENSDKPYDTNWFRRNPRLLKLGDDITLLGMEISLLTMKRGELSRFLYSPAYAYGALGCLPLIPPSSTILFEIEVLDFLDTAEVDLFFNMSKNQLARIPLEKMLKIAEMERKFGNNLFKRNRYHDAKDRYKRASSYLSRIGKSETENEQLEAARLPVNLNLALIYLRLERPSKSLQWGEKALAIQHNSVKALFRCGQACLDLREYEKARTFLFRAQKIEPFNAEINSELRRLESCYKNYKDQQRELCLRMFAKTI